MSNNIVIAWFQRNIITTVIIPLLLMLCGFVYNHASLPTDNEKFNEVHNDIKEIKDYNNNDRLEKEGMKKDIKFTQQTVIDLKADMKEGMKEIYNQLREINRKTK